MSRKKTKIERDYKNTVTDLAEKRSEILDKFAEAYCVDNGVLPSQIELVEKQEYAQVTWHFRMKKPEMPALEAEASERLVEN